MKVKSYQKFLESENLWDDEYSIYDWYSDLRHGLRIEIIKKWSDIFLGPGILEKIEKRVDDMLSMLSRVDLKMIDDMLVELYDYVPSGKLKNVTYAVFHGDVDRINEPDTQSKFNASSCFIKINNDKKWDIIKDIILEIIRPTLYVNLEGEDCIIRGGEAKYGSKYDKKYTCSNFNIDDYMVGWAGDNVKVSTLPHYRIKFLENYDINNYINIRQPGIYIDIDNGSYDYFKLDKTEEILDDITPMINDYLEEKNVYVKEFMFDNNRGTRQYNSNTDIMDYTLKVLLKLN